MEHIVGGESLKDFWTLGANGNLYHFLSGNWKTYPKKVLFSPVSFRSYLPVLLQPNRVIILLTDMDWHTHLTEINRGKIIRYGIISHNAITQTLLFRHHLYALGNFGSVLKLSNGKWLNIDSPIQSHIMSAINDKNNYLWLGTRRQGLFSYDGKKFRHYKLPGKTSNEAISSLKTSGDTLFAITSKGTVLRLTGDSLSSVTELKNPFNKKITLLSNGYYKIVSRKNKIWYIPYFYKLLAFKELHNGRALILTSDNRIFYSHYVKYNFFLNFATLADLEGPKFSYTPRPGFLQGESPSLYNKMSPGIIFSDFNHDNYDDILFFNVSDERHPFLYLNNRHHYFNNVAPEVGLNQFTFNGFISYAYDLNGDDTPEIISTDFKNREYFLNILEKSAGKYRLLDSVPIPGEYAVNPVQNVCFSDIDQDGNLDIALVFGYSKHGKGNILFLKNNGYGNFTQSDTSLLSPFKGWNVQAIFADFNNDGKDDIFVSRNWGPNVIFFRRKSSGWRLYKLKTQKNFRTQQRKSGTLAFDYDNDGDLDLITLAQQPFIRLFENDGKGNFTDITQKSGLDILNTNQKSGHITAGDFDNNGFIDLFVSLKDKKLWKNYLFLNDSLHHFIDHAREMGLAASPVEFAATGDIDNDGDLDLYGFRQGSNVLWMNNLDSNNYLNIRLKGIRANYEAMGTKIWLYIAGHLNNEKFLVGYRQTGSKISDRNYQNSNVTHFGVKTGRYYDLKIVFPGGSTKILQNIPSGTSLQVAELTAPVSWLYTWDNRLHLLLKNKEFLSYLGSILAGLLILMFAIYSGVNKFNWDVKLTTVIVSLNLIIFGLLLLALHSSTPLLKYYLPLGVVIAGSLGPLGFFLWIKKFSNLKSQKENERELFQALLSFSHGAWAASNMNSLQLFFENLSVEELNDSVYGTPFGKRRETFLQMTVPVIEKIITLSETQQENKDIITEIEKNKTFLVSRLNNDHPEISSTDKDKLVASVGKIRELLSRLRNHVFAGYSCYPAKVLQQIQTELAPLLEEQQVGFRLFSRIQEDYPALIPAEELANILDNSIQNTLKALAKAGEKQLSIKILQEDPRIYIEITDNGCGIPPENLEKIFENGFSSTKGTGYGLFYAKETLKKYGGRIYVKTSIPYRQTTFVIELQKGSKK